MLPITMVGADAHIRPDFRVEVGIDPYYFYLLGNYNFYGVFPKR